MSKFILIPKGEEKIYLSVVSNMEFGGKQSVIVYESPGTNGGTVITTGRTNNHIVLTGKILLPFQSDAQRQSPNAAFPFPSITLNEIKAKLQKLRNNGTPVQLIAPVDNDDTGQYIIEEFRANVLEGQESFIPFTMTLQEYRQANIQTASVNLVNFLPAQEFVKRLKDTNKLP